MRSLITLLFITATLLLSMSACVVTDDEPEGVALLRTGPTAAADELAPPPGPGPIRKPPADAPPHACELFAESWCRMLRQCQPESDIDLEACRTAELDACCEGTYGCELQVAPAKRDACIDDIEAQACPARLEWPISCDWAG